MGRRRFIILPILTYLTSIGSFPVSLALLYLTCVFEAFGIVGMKDVKKYGTSALSQFTPQLASSFITWVPALAFSCAIDGLCTTMITGRLLYYYLRQRKSGTFHGTSYLSVIAIFIESAALSTISKILQLTVTSTVISRNLVCIPLCVSKN